ncbi:hypothetical protein [Nocardiopsis composta]|uniref:Uncharacterized protein n=1 Tax=Nocardiopsis composta TaxID=157465 RepID=A0A7W8QI72_9ACTN|nr:hypothetical protein [Nocardiopsis composta]MBB5429996.1 hypothetical protein [Nocardiopsis composta]
MSAPHSPAAPDAARTRGLVRTAGLVTAAHWLFYTAEKAYLAAAGRLGMLGSPDPPASAYREIPDVAAAQLGNAAIGALATALVLLSLTRAARILPRPLLLGALLLITLATAGAVALVAPHGNWAHLALSAAGLCAAALFTYASFRRLPGTAHGPTPR